MTRRKVHIIFWTFWFVMGFVIDYIQLDMKIQYELSYFITQNLFLFYGFSYCLKTFSRKSTKSIIWGVLRFVIVIGIFFYVRYWLRYYVLFTLFKEPIFRQFNIRDLNIGSLLWVISYFLLASGYYYFEKSLEKEKVLQLTVQELTRQQLLAKEAEREKAVFEQAFIQAQINPHFLYNVLSYLYSEALQYSEKLAETIHLLSEIMRYCLLPGNNHQNKVLLSREVDYMENFIKLNQFRFNHQLQIALNIQGNIHTMFIAPMVLMTFLENIFKHGELRDPEHPARIDIAFFEGRLIFKSTNKKQASPSKQLSDGIGLDFIKKRLTYVYGKSYSLDIREDNSFYSVDLVISNA